MKVKPPLLIRVLSASIWSFVAFIALAFVFAILPSPAVLESKIVSDLQNGVPVMRAYKFGSFLPYPTFPSEVTYNFQTAIAFEWSFSADTRTLRINNQHDIVLESEFGPGQVTAVNATVITNVLDGVQLPSFNMADAALLNNVITPQAAVLPLELKQRSISTTTTIYDVVGYSQKRISNLRPLLTITYDSTSASPSIPRFDIPQEPYSVSPSATFFIRRAILIVLVPVASMVMFTSLAAFALIKLLLAGAALVGLLALLFGPMRSWIFFGSAGKEESETLTKESNTDASNAAVGKTSPGSVDNMV